MAVVRAKPYEWLFDDENDRDRLDYLRNVKEYLEYLERKPTKITWRVRDMLHHAVEGVTDLSLVGDSYPMSTEEYYQYPRELLEFHGAWQVPYHMRSSDSDTHYVNPNAVHAHTYADAVSKCECGAIVSSTYYRHADVDAHSSDCTHSQRKEAYKRVERHRHHLTYECGDLYWNVDDLAPRFGLETNQGGVSYWMNQHDFDWPTLRKKGRARMVASWKMLHSDHSRSYREIGEAFDVPKSTVGTYVRGSCERAPSVTVVT